MDRHIYYVANFFYAASAMLGIPSALGFLYTAFQLVQMQVNGPRPATPVAPDADNMLKVIDGATKIAAAPFRFLAWAGQWVIVVAVILSILILLLSAVLFFTARGLHMAQAWAKLPASLFLLMLLSMSLSGSAGLRRSILIVVPLAGLAGCVYALWALWRRPV